MNKIKIFSVFDVPGHPGVENNLASMTQQHFKDEVNINTIVAKAKLTGFLGDPLKPGTRKPMYGDFSNIGSYQDAQDMLLYSQSRFMELPANIRYRFHNDPSEFLEFMDDPENEQEAIKLGLLPKKPTSSNNPAGAEPTASKEPLKQGDGGPKKSDEKEPKAQSIT